METRWLYTNSPDLLQLCEESKGVCVIPMGCIEKHGLHAPLGTDIIRVNRVAYEASKLETVTVFPDFTFGDVPMGSPTAPRGTITIPVELQMQLLETLCEQIARWGYTKIFVLNGHGGNNGWLGVFARKMANQKRNFVFAYTTHPHLVPHKMAELILENGSGYIPELTKEDEELLIKYHEEGMTIGHACMNETANMMGICPENVHLDRLGIESGLSTHATDYLSNAKINITLGWDINFPNTFAGHDPVGCNERIGKASVRIASEIVASQYKLLKEDTNIEKWLLEDYQKGW